MIEAHKHKVSFHFTFLQLPVRNSTRKEAKYYTQQSTNFASLILSAASLSWANILKDFWQTTIPFFSQQHRACPLLIQHREVALILIFSPKSCCCLTDLICQRTGSILWNRESTTRKPTHDSSWVAGWLPVPKAITFGQRKPQPLHQSKHTHAVPSLFASLPHLIHTAQVFCHSRFQPS